jgi:predicted GNAT family acetyltransferase
VKPHHDEIAHRFTLAFPEGEARLDYERVAIQRVIFTHTFVPPSLRGRGAAEALVRSGLEWARTEGLSIESSCSYVARFLERHPELRTPRRS